jgi:glc operon protein GlcG
MRTKHVITCSDASIILDACRSEADRNGWKVSVAIVDDGGHLLAAMRFDGAGFQTVDVAVRKARAAAMTGMSTKALESMVADRPAILSFGDRLLIQGGLPIMTETGCGGAVGVSGARSDQDETIAQAGIAALGCS